jgi:hypothetical protein
VRTASSFAASTNSRSGPDLRATHPFLRHAITSLLAGDVFAEDARWAEELRTRFPANKPDRGSA